MKSHSREAQDSLDVDDEEMRRSLIRLLIAELSIR